MTRLLSRWSHRLRFPLACIGFFAAVESHSAQGDSNYATKEYEAALALAKAFAEAERLADAEPLVVEREGDVLRLAGPVSADMLEAVKSELDRGGLKRLVIKSNGGYVEAGQAIGHLIHVAKLTVIVDEYCVSSCANYIFTAGYRRIIPNGAYVAWHGNTFQKSGREFDLCGRTVSSLDGLPWLPEDIEERKADAAGIQRRRAQDLHFFSTVGVNEYIARAGQEPKNYGNFTMTEASMRRLGLQRIEAPKNYGTPAYCAMVSAKRPSLGLQCIEVTDEMLAYEKARLALGEVCTPDGTLQVNTSRLRP